MVDSKDMKKDDAIFNILRETIIEIKDFLLADSKAQKKKNNLNQNTNAEGKTTAEALLLSLIHI